MPRIDSRCNDPRKFWKRVDMTGDCWYWLGKSNGSGYGQLWYRGEHVLAHRLAWCLVMGKIPSDSCVLHHCDNRMCVNPRHLFLGDRTDNAEDKVSKNRQSKGENASHKITTQDVLDIREKYKNKEANTYQLAQEYQLNQSTVTRIINGKRWAHVPNICVRM